MRAGKCYERGPEDASRERTRLKPHRFRFGFSQARNLWGPEQRNALDVALLKSCTRSASRALERARPARRGAARDGGAPAARRGNASRPDSAASKARRAVAVFSDPRFGGMVLGTFAETKVPLVWVREPAFNLLESQLRIRTLTRHFAPPSPGGRGVSRSGFPPLRE